MPNFLQHPAGVPALLYAGATRIVRRRIGPSTDLCIVRARLGTTIQASGGLALQAGRQITARAATMDVGGALMAIAANDIRICIRLNQSLGPVGTSPPIAIEVGLGTPRFNVGAGAAAHRQTR